MIETKVDKRCPLPSNTDFNTVLTSGFYRLSNTTQGTNAPPDGSWGQMLVISGGGDTITQIVFSYNTSERFNLRSEVCKALGGSKDSWTEWKVFKSA